MAQYLYILHQGVFTTLSFYADTMKPHEAMNRKSRVAVPAAAGIIAVLLLLLIQTSEAQPVYVPAPDPGYYGQGSQRSQRSPYDRRGYNQWYRNRGSEYITMGIFVAPVISWFATDSYDSRNEGALPGTSFGVSYNSYFGDNYSFSTGISIINAGGRLSYTEEVNLDIRNFGSETITIDPGETIIYRMHYVSFPLGLKLQTDERSNGRYFIDFGFDPKIMVSGRTDIPSLRIRGGNAWQQLRMLHLSYHLGGGLEFPLGSLNSVAAGIRFDNTFTDITRNNRNQPWDIITHKMLIFTIGINF